MEQKTLEVEIREEVGKKGSKALRRTGLIPAVVYDKKKTDSIIINEREFEHAIHTKAGINIIINLNIKGKKKKTMAVIKELQHHPLSGKILHIDFKAISMKDTVDMNIPVAVKGEALGVKEGGILEHNLWELAIKCLPTDIPQEIKVDVSSLNIGDSIHVKEIELPEGMTCEDNPESVVLSVIAPKIAEETPAEEGEEGPQEPEVIGEKKEEAESEESK